MRGAKLGRPLKMPRPGERISLGLKVTPEIKTRLDAAARYSGRTQSQETELRLEQSFRAEGLLSPALELAYGRPLAALLMMLGRGMSTAGRHGAAAATQSFDKMDAWPSNPYAFDQAAQAAKVIIDGLRPPGDPKFSTLSHAALLSVSPEHLGQDIGAGILSAVKDPDSVNKGLPIEEQNQDRMIFAKEVNKLLGDLAARIQAPSPRSFRNPAREGSK